MALKFKRKKERILNIEEMMSFINKDFMNLHNNGLDQQDDIAHYVLSPTAFQDEKKKWLMIDSRDDNDDGYEYDDFLPIFYGATIIEVVEKAYMYMKYKENHG